ncbi:MAG TPA: MBL fold metallo-hydrolase [Aquabacterium sp.]|nr:MBL fold metallo-hydrolase [Aquabacterium sp.]
MNHSDLHYPFDQTVPATGDIMQISGGINWVRMPLPFALNHINLWMLDDEADGKPSLCVVDAGVAVEPIRLAWKAVWTKHSGNRSLSRMIVTHMHPDHVGNAQWLIQEFSALNAPARLWMSAADHLAAQLSCKETMGYGGESATRFFRAHGLKDEGSLTKIEQRSGYYASMVPDVPRVYRRMLEGMEIRIGQRTWRCLTGYGHSPEHISLFDAAHGVLISGDMLLPRISTNISVINLEPEADPLGLYLDSLDRLTALPPDTLVLPSHGHPFVGIQARVDQLKAHHQARLADVMQACKESPKSAAELLPVLFKRDLDLHQTTFAMGESIAHLNYLWHRGQLQRHQAVDGTWLFSL